MDCLWVLLKLATVLFLHKLVNFLPKPTFGVHNAVQSEFSLWLWRVWLLQIQILTILDNPPFPVSDLTASQLSAYHSQALTIPQLASETYLLYHAYLTFPKHFIVIITFISFMSLFLNRTHVCKPFTENVGSTLGIYGTGKTYQCAFCKVACSRPGCSAYWGRQRKMMILG